MSIPKSNGLKCYGLNYLQMMILLFLVLLVSSQANAHFGMVIAENPVANQQKKATNISLSFSHPFEGIGMKLERPEKFFVKMGEETTDLTGALQQISVMGKLGWQANYNFTRPGVYSFAMVPKPYWEPAEDLFIIHYTKTIIPAYGDDVGWDEPVGLPTEIVPLLRPFGNFQGNTFMGQVLVKGEPVSGAEVEVEFYNTDNSISAPSDYHITQVVKTDANGNFTFTCPLAGWWGFAALTEGDYSLKTPDGKEKGVELGAVLWVYFDKL